MIEIIDDYLPQHEYENIRAYFEGDRDDGTLKGSCPWVFFPGCVGLDDPDDHFHFTHLVFAQHSIISPAFNLMTPIIKKEGMSSIARIKANCVVRTEKLKVLIKGFHTDFPQTLTTGIYYINTNDGYTLFEDGTRCDSVANRFCRFPCTTRHTATTCTTTDRRLLINFNYSTYD